MRLEEAATGGDWSMVIERAPIEQFVANYAYQTDIAPTNATFRFEDTNLAVVPSAEGRAADVGPTTDGIMAALEARASGSPTPGAPLALAAVAPTFTTADAEAIAPRVSKISEWTTNLRTRPAQRRRCEHPHPDLDH